MKIRGAYTIFSKNENNQKNKKGVKNQQKNHINSKLTQKMQPSKMM